MEERIIELETRLAYQDKLVADLDEVVRAFSERVEKLERQLRRLESERHQQQETLEPHNTPPPHY